MNEHAPMPGDDAADLEMFFAHNVKRSVLGIILERGAAFGIAAIEDKEDKRARNAVMRRQAAADGQSLAALPWDMLAETARPINETHSYDPNRIAVEHDFKTAGRLAFASRRLERMARAGAHHAVQVLEVYFGPIGNHYAIGFTDDVPPYRPLAPLPRVFSLMHLVPAGRKLLARGQDLLAPSAFERSEYVRMRSHCTFRESSKYRPLRELFVRAELQAQEAYRAAADAWNTARKGPNP